MIIFASIIAPGSLPSAVRYSDHQSPKMGGDGEFYNPTVTAWLS